MFVKGPIFENGEYLCEVRALGEFCEAVHELVDPKPLFERGVREWFRVRLLEPDGDVREVSRVNEPVRFRRCAAAGVRAHAEKIGQVPVGAVGMRHLQIDEPDDVPTSPDALAEVEVVVGHHLRTVVDEGSVPVEQTKNAVEVSAIPVGRAACDVREGVDEVTSLDDRRPAEQTGRMQMLRGRGVECSRR